MANYELAAFEAMGAKRIAKMPGQVECLRSVKDELWAACTIKRRWWEPWRPAEYTRWFKVDVPDEA